MARPEKPIDWDKVDQLLMAGCHGTEIASYFNMHPNTFYTKLETNYKCGFTEFSALKKSHGDALLRNVQFEKALDKDNTMMIWLGKQRLGQKENKEESIDKANLIALLKAFHEGDISQT